MITISTDQALERWDLLPDNLREALYSEANSDFLWRTCEDESVPDQKIYEVSKVAGYVLMGFLHPEDVALEIIERLALDKKTATDIQEALNKRVFAPLRADIDKAYKPLSKFEVSPHVSAPADSTSIGPKIMSSISTPASAVSATIKPMATMSAVPVPAPVKIPSPAEGKFPPLTQTGWSKTMVTQKTTPGPVAASSDSAISRIKPLAPPSALGPAPVILHEDAKFASVDKSTDFHLARPGSGAEVPLAGISSQQKVKPAVLELGTLANAPTNSAIATPKFTHYTQFQSSAATSPTRNVTEVTSASPVTAAPSKPSTSISIPASSPTSNLTSVSKPISSAVPIPQPPKPPTISQSQQTQAPPQARAQGQSQTQIAPPPKPPIQKNYP